MIAYQVRRLRPDHTPAEVIDAAEIQHTATLSGTAQLTCQVSLAVSEGMASWVRDHPGRPMLLELEQAVDGGDWVPVPHGRMVAYKGDLDDSDPTGTVTITCMDYVSWELGGARLDKGETTIGPLLGDSVLRLLEPARLRGWGTNLITDFTRLVDSAGYPWVEHDSPAKGLKVSGPDMLSAVLAKLVDAGGCEWSATGSTLQLYIPGNLGEDRTQVVLGGPEVSRAPGSWDATEMVTNLTVIVTDKDIPDQWLEMPVPGADATLGRREAVMTMSDTLVSAAPALAAPTLTAAAAPKREQSFEWIVDDAPVPYVDFMLGDWVTAQTSEVTGPARVVEIVTHQDSDGVVTCAVVTGDKIMSLRARRDRRASSLTVGQIIGGSGVGLSPNALSAEPPAQVTGLEVARNVASWGEPGQAPVTEIEIRWTPVTRRADDSPLTPRGYEVSTRTLTGTPVVEWVDGTRYSVLGWELGVERIVTVRAVSADGERGEWAVELSVTPTIPAAITAAPAAPSMVAGLGSVAIYTGWQLATSAALPAQAAQVRAEAATSVSGPWTALAGGATRAGQVAVARADSGTTVYARLYWVDALGRESDRSTVVSTTVAGVGTTDLTTELSGQIVAAIDGAATAIHVATLAEAIARGLVVVSATDPGHEPGRIWWQLAEPDEDEEPSAPRCLGITYSTGTHWLPVVLAADQVLAPGSVSTGILDAETIWADEAWMDRATVGVLRAGVVRAEHLVPDIGGQINLEASESIQILAGATQYLAGRLTDAEGTLHELGQAVRFSADGTRWTTPGSDLSVLIRHDMIEMRRGGIALSQWADGEMRVPAIRAQQTIIGATIVQENPNGVSWSHA